MWSGIKNSRLAQLLGMTWIVCFISHILIPVVIAFPLFTYVFGRTEDPCSGHAICGDTHVHGHIHSHVGHTWNEMFVEMLVFLCVIIPVSIVVNYVYIRIRQRRQKAIGVTVCDTCPDKEEAFDFVMKHCSPCCDHVNTCSSCGHVSTCTHGQHNNCNN